MSTTSTARPYLIWLGLAVITAGVSACGGGSGGVSPAPVGTDTSSGTPDGLSAGNRVPVEGTLSDGNDPLANEGNLPQAEEQSLDQGASLPVNSDAEDLDEVAGDLRRRFIDDAKRGLVGINNAYVSGTLEQSKFFCFDDEYPITDYFCGGNDRSSFVTEYGSELVGFRFDADEQCTGPLIEQGTAESCFLEYTEIHYGERWNAVYRFVEIDFEFFEEVRVSDRTAEFGADACEVTYGTASETFYNDDALCDQMLRSVAVDASAP